MSLHQLPLYGVSSTWLVMHLQVSTWINPGWLTSISRNGTSGRLPIRRLRFS